MSLFLHWSKNTKGEPTLRNQPMSHQWVETNLFDYT